MVSDERLEKWLQESRDRLDGFDRIDGEPLPTRDLLPVAVEALKSSLKTSIVTRSGGVAMDKGSLSCAVDALLYLVRYMERVNPDIFDE